MQHPTPTLELPTARLGVLLVVCGPSGSGKTTLCRRLCQEGEAMFSVSCTTRAPRPGEEHGRDYFFLSVEDFEERVARGEFFEYARVHGNLYGTLKSYVGEHLSQGQDVLLDIDVQGATQVRDCDDTLIQQCMADIFILPPSVEELRQRLSGRGTEDEAVLALRMNNSLHEMEHWPQYRYTLLSGTHEADYARFRSLLVAERMRVSRLR